MKIRNGFVSNSSTSSFCLGKNYMTKEQIKKFNEYLEEINEANDGERYIDQDDLYFMGTISDHNDVILNVIDELDLNKFASFFE